MPVADSSRAFLAGGGEMGAVMRAHDWSTTPLGPVKVWPASLRTAVGIMLSTHHPVFIFWGQELACLYNDAYAASLGAEKHPSILGRPAPEAWPEAYPLVAADLSQVMSGGGATWRENNLVPITRHDRLEEVYWTYSYGPIHEPAAANCVGGVLTLITETTKAVTALRQSELRYRSLFESIDAGFCILEVKFDQAGGAADYRFVEINPAFERLTGIVDATGQWMRDIAPDHEQRWFDIYGHVALTGESARFEDHAAALGDRWFDVHAFRVGEPGEHRVAVLFNNISETVHAKAALRASEAQGRNVLEKMGEAFVLLDRDYRIVDLNAEATRLENRPREAIIGKTHWEAHPDAAPELTDLYRLALAEQREVSLEHRYVWPDGRDTWLAMRAFPVGDGLAIFYRDVTDRKAVGEALRDSEERQTFLLKLSDALASLSDSADIEAAAARLAAGQLSVGWCYFNVFDDRGTHATVLGDFHRDGLPSMVGVHDLSGERDFLDLMGSEAMLDMPDLTSSELFSAQGKAAYGALGMRSALGSGLIVS